jgi:fructose-bisphosphate aldolase class II
MPLIPFPRLLHTARENNFAIGYFEAWNDDSLETVLEAAEQAVSPVVLGFGGLPVNQPWFNKWGLGFAAALGRFAADKSKVPVSLILNETKTFKQAAEGIELGFNVVMLDSSSRPFEKNLEITKKLVYVAHQRNVAVQAELGHLPVSGKETASTRTDPDEAAVFVQKTGIDALAVSVGNVHEMVSGTAEIDTALVEKIHVKTEVPLVIHGGTGFPSKAVPDVIRAGAALFHVGSILKLVYFEGLRTSVEAVKLPIDIQRIVGSREREDLTSEGKLRLRQKVIELSELYGSAGKADLY